MSLNSRIKEARLNAGLTQEQLGKTIGVAKTTVAGYEKNREPDAPTLGAIIDALGVDANFLFQDEIKALKTNDFTIPELKHIKKYRTLDEHGKDVVDVVLDKEYERMLSKRQPISIAARGGDTVQGYVDGTDEELEQLLKECEQTTDL